MAYDYDSEEDFRHSKKAYDSDSSGSVHQKKVVKKQRKSESSSRSRSPKPKPKKDKKYRDVSRERSLSRGRTRKYSAPSRRQRSRSRSRSQPRTSGRRESPRERSPDGYRLHIADLDADVRKEDMERLFRRYGELIEIWMARNPPCFAFVVYKDYADARKALREANGVVLGCRPIKVSEARPRARGRSSRGFDPNMRCYQCGEPGHFSRNCTDSKYGYKRPASPPMRRMSRSRSPVQQRRYSPGYERNYRGRRSRSRDGYAYSSRRGNSPGKSRYY